MTGREQDQAAAACVEEFLTAVKRETGDLRHRISRMACALEDVLTGLNSEFVIDFGWRLGTARPTEQFWMKVQYPTRTIEPTAAVAKELL